MKITVKNNLCAVCGGKLFSKKIMVDHIRDGKIYLFEKVAAFVCNRCGEIWYSSKTSEWMDWVLSNKVKAKRKISVPVYSEVTTEV